MWAEGAILTREAHGAQRSLQIILQASERARLLPDSHPHHAGPLRARKAPHPGHPQPERTVPLSHRPDAPGDLLDPIRLYFAQELQGEVDSFWTHPPDDASPRTARETVDLLSKANPHRLGQIDRNECSNSALPGFSGVGG
jgi:hypothetical protein